MLGNLLFEMSSDEGKRILDHLNSGLYVKPTSMYIL